LYINKQKQNRHIEGTREYQEYKEKLQKVGFMPSILEVDTEELLKQYSGKGRIIISSGNQPPKESIKADYYVGKYYDRDKGEWVTTQWAMICYSKTGVHIYPKEADKY
jgi:hypothetical protein